MGRAAATVRILVPQGSGFKRTLAAPRASVAAPGFARGCVPWARD